MDNDTKKIYNAIFGGKCSKEYLATLLNKTEKTVENRIKECREIKWSKKSQCYHFENLLPGFISYNHLYKLLLGNINNINIKKDLESTLNQNDSEDHFIMIDTSALSTIFQNHIKLTIAIHHQCNVLFSYIGYKQKLETKYVKPHKVFISNGILYLYAQYTSKNKKNIDEMRNFALNSISQLEIDAYHDIDFQQEVGETNAFGVLSDKSKSVNLIFESWAAIFLKREGLVDFHWSFISEDVDGKISVTLFYNHEQEVVTLLQKWMPSIYFKESIDENSKQIATMIRENFGKYENK